jgi:hypothetical protein
LASSCRSGPLAAALGLLAAAAPLGAQGRPGPLVLAGRAVRVAGRDSAALAGALIVAHHIGQREQGPVDSLRSDAAGRFRFRIASPDSGAMYVVSTLYAGIGYFSEPVSVREPGGADTLRLAVYDTSSSGAPLNVGMRHVVVSAPGADGSRDVLDIVQVANPGATTRVARGGAAPTWRMRLPEGVQSFHVGESDVPATAVRQSGDTVLLSAPIPPGVKQLVMTYVLPRGEGALQVPIDQPTARLELLVEDSSASASGAMLAAANPVQLEGRTFRRFSASRIAAGEAASVRFGTRGGGGAPGCWGSVGGRRCAGAAGRPPRGRRPRRPRMATRCCGGSWRSTSVTRRGRPRRRRRSGASTSASGRRSRPSWPGGLRGADARPQIASSDNRRSRTGIPEAGVSPARPRHCNG